MELIMEVLAPALPYIYYAGVAIIAAIIVWVAKKFNIQGLTFDEVMQVLLRFLIVEMNPRGAYDSLPRSERGNLSLPILTSRDKMLLANTFIHQTAPEIAAKLDKKEDGYEKVFAKLKPVVNGASKYIT